MDFSEPALGKPPLVVAQNRLLGMVWSYHLLSFGQISPCCPATKSFSPARGQDSPQIAEKWQILGFIALFLWGMWFYCTVLFHLQSLATLLLAQRPPQKPSSFIYFSCTPENIHRALAVAPTEGFPHLPSIPPPRQAEGEPLPACVPAGDAAGFPSPAGLVLHPPAKVTATSDVTHASTRVCQCSPRGQKAASGNSVRRNHALPPATTANRDPQSQARHPQQFP